MKGKETADFDSQQDEGGLLAGLQDLQETVSAQGAVVLDSQSGKSGVTA